MHQRGSVEHLERGADSNNGLERTLALLRRPVLAFGQVSGPGPVAKLSSKAFSTLKQVLGKIDERIQILRYCAKTRTTRAAEIVELILDGAKQN